MSWPRALGWFLPGRAQGKRDPGLHLLLWQVPVGHGGGNSRSLLQQVRLVVFFSIRCLWMSQVPSDTDAMLQ